MPRNRNTNINGIPFGASTKDQVWNKGKIIPEIDPNYRRKDICETIIQKSAYGDIGSKFGWEIDHIQPVSKNGSDNINNLQPLYWETNRDKADKWPWKCGM